MDKLLNDKVLYKIEDYKEWELIVKLLEEETNKFLELGIGLHLFAVPSIEEEVHYEYNKYNSLYFRIRIYCFKENSNKLELLELFNRRICFYKGVKEEKEYELSSMIKKAYYYFKKLIDSGRLNRRIYGE